MAYINAEQAKEIREELKSVFGKYGWRFSVRVEDRMALNVAIMKGPIDMEKHGADTYEQINTYHIDSDYNNEYSKPLRDFLKLVNEICNRKNWDNSDPQTDYFDVGYYFHLHIGKWDKPYQKV